MLTRADFKTAAEHIAYTQGIIDAGRERVPMTEYERADLRLRAMVEAHKHILHVLNVVEADDSLDEMCKVIAEGSSQLAGSWLDTAIKPDKEV